MPRRIALTVTVPRYRERVVAVSILRAVTIFITAAHCGHSQSSSSSLHYSRDRRMLRLKMMLLGASAPVAFKAPATATAAVTPNVRFTGLMSGRREACLRRR